MTFPIKSPRKFALDITEQKTRQNNLVLAWGYLFTVRPQFYIYPGEARRSVRGRAHCSARVQSRVNDFNSAQRIGIGAFSLSISAVFSPLYLHLSLPLLLYIVCMYVCMYVVCKYVSVSVSVSVCPALYLSLSLIVIVLTLYFDPYMQKCSCYTLVSAPQYTEVETKKGFT